MKKLKNLKARVLSFVLTLVTMLSVVVGTPAMEVEAATFATPVVDTSSIVLYESGCLKEITLTVQALNQAGGYSQAYGRIGIHTSTSPYDWDNRFTRDGSSWPADSEFKSQDTTFVCFANGEEFLWTDLEPHTITFQFDDGKVDLSQSQNYTIHLWTRAAAYGIYTDATIGTLRTQDGKLLDGSGNTLACSHSWSEYTTDAEKHSRTCSSCSKVEEAAHADSDTNNSCDACGYDMTSAHTHDMVTKYNENGHWTECSDSNCTEKTESVPHVYENDTDTTCDCGYTRTVETPRSTVTVTFNRDGYVGDDLFAYGVNSMYDNVYLYETGDQVTARTDMPVRVVANEEFVVTATNGDISDVRQVNEEGNVKYEAEIANFTDDFTITVTKAGSTPAPEPETIEITVNDENLKNGYVVFGLYPDGVGSPYYFSSEEEGPAILENETDDVRLFIYANDGYEMTNDLIPTVTAGDATVGELTYSSEEGFYWCIIDGFTTDTEIVINGASKGIDYGTFEKDATVGTGSPVAEAKLNNAERALIEALFTGTDKDGILDGTLDAKVWLEVSKIDTVPETQKTAIENKVAELGANSNITYFDASLFKQIGTNAADPVSNPGMDIEITIKIPAELINNDSNKTRTYKMLRYHDGEGVTLIEGTFSNGEFTFKTDKFSTYAIIYKDVASSGEGTATPQPGGGTGGNTGGGNTGSGSSSNSSSSSSSSSSTPATASNTTATPAAVANQPLVKDDVPKTGEGLDYALMLAVAFLVTGTFGMLSNKQKRRQ